MGTDIVAVYITSLGWECRCGIFGSTGKSTYIHAGYFFEDVVCVRLRARMCVCVCVFVCAWMRGCTRGCVYILVCIRVCICVYVCMYVCRSITTQLIDTGTGLMTIVATVMVPREVLRSRSTENSIAENERQNNARDATDKAPESPAPVTTLPLRPPPPPSSRDDRAKRRTLRQHNGRSSRSLSLLQRVLCDVKDKTWVALGMYHRKSNVEIGGRSGRTISVRRRARFGVRSSTRHKREIDFYRPSRRKGVCHPSPPPPPPPPPLHPPSSPIVFIQDFSESGFVSAACLCLLQALVRSPKPPKN
jgi:hypothetical protein